MASTRLLTKSVASCRQARKRPPSARRTIISRLESRWLSGPLKPSRIAATRIFTNRRFPRMQQSDLLRLFVVCCARAPRTATTAAAPLRSVMNSRLFTRSPHRRRASTAGGISTTERLGGLEVDHKLELGRILHRQIGGLLAPKDAIDVARHAPVRIDRIRPVGDQTSGRNKTGGPGRPPVIDAWPRAC